MGEEHRIETGSGLIPQTLIVRHTPNHCVVSTRARGSTLLLPPVSTLTHYQSYLRTPRADDDYPALSERRCRSAAERRRTDHRRRVVLSASRIKAVGAGS